MKQLTVVFSLILIIALVMALPQSSVAQDERSGRVCAPV